MMKFNNANNRLGLRAILIIMVIIILPSCTGIPEGLKPVSSFNADRYLGQWYEIARLDHRFERNMKNVTAN